MGRRWQHIRDWFDLRLGLSDLIWPMLRHPIPPKVGWWYVFGSASLTLLIMQLVTGVLLASYYVASAGQAYENLQYITEHEAFGRYLRSLHYWGSSAMVVMVTIHMTRVFITGSFKYPRELTWVVGVILLICTLGMAFTGQVLRWDQDAYWGVGVGASMAGRIPWLGPILLRVLFGGANIGGATLSHFFVLHVFVILGLLVVAAIVHVHMVVKLGISEWPSPERPVDPQTYLPWYHGLLKRQGVPFFPDEFMKDALFSGVVILAVLVIALLAGPKGPGGPPDPALIDTQPRPDWPFLPIFALLALSPRWLETTLMLALPPVIFLVLFLVPFLTRRGQRAPSRRPVAVLGVAMAYVTTAVLLWAGIQSPWSPRMNDWTAEAVPADIVRRLTPLELEGAAVFQNKTCRNCHALQGIGGQRGPDLTDVGSRLEADELIRQVIQGGGLMPAFGKQLRPVEVDALVAFMRGLRPSNELLRESGLRRSRDVGMGGHTQGP